MNYRMDYTLELPDELLQECLASCPRESRGSVRLVCRRWCCLHDQMVDSLDLRYSLRNRGRPGFSPPDPAALPRLARLPLTSAALPTDLPEALETAQQLTQLTSLVLWHAYERPEDWQPEASFGRQFAAQPFDMACLAQLRQLDVQVDDMQASSCEQLSALTGLETLSLKTFQEQVPAQLWASLACMQQLENLVIGVETSDEGAPCYIPSAAWQALQCCQQLSFLKIEHHFMTTPAFEPLVGEFVLAPGIASLASLRELCLEGSFASSGDLWQHPHLTCLRLADTRRDVISIPPGGIDMHSLRKLVIRTEQESELPRPPLPLAQLSAVTALELLCADPDDPGLGALVQLPSLASLRLSFGYHPSRRGRIPASILRLTGLRALDISGNQLEALPKGPYLGSLRTLLLAENKLCRLPLVLRRANQLEVLDFGKWSNEAPAVRLEMRDLTLLQQLPALRMICVPCFDGYKENLSLLSFFSLFLPRLAYLTKIRWESRWGNQPTALFPRGWDGGMDEASWQAVMDAVADPFKRIMLTHLLTDSKLNIRELLPISTIERLLA